MTSSQEPDRARTLVEAIALAAERLLGPSDRPHMPEVLVALGRAAAVSRIALVAARTGGAGSSPRMEVRHQWAAPGMGRLQPAGTGWPRYPQRWHEALVRGEVLSGPVGGFPPAERAVIEATGCRSIMLIPVVVGDHWYGHLEVGDAAEDRAWLVDEVGAMRAAAGIVGRSIAQRQAMAALERRSAILAAVGDATSILLEASNWRAALPRVLDSLRTATRARSAWAYGPDPGQPGRRATLLYEVLAPGARSAGGHTRFVDFTPEAASLLVQGHPVHDRLPAAGHDPLHAALMLRGVASWVMVPLDLGSGAIGVVGLDSERSRPWTDGEIEGLHVLAGALRAAILRGGTLVSVPVVANSWGRESFPATAGPASNQAITADAETEAPAEATARVDAADTGA